MAGVGGAAQRGDGFTAPPSWSGTTEFLCNWNEREAKRVKGKTKAAFCFLNCLLVEGAGAWLVIKNNNHSTHLNCVN